MKNNRFAFVCVAIVMLVTLLACSATGAAPTPTPTFTVQPTTVPTQTPRPTFTPWPTATPNLIATQQVTDMQALVQSLVSRGYLSSADGQYYHLDDFSNTWAQIGWYQWSETPYYPKDFVMRANFSWESASHTPNPSGCGVVFHLQSSGDHYMVFVSTLGYVFAYSSVGGDVNRLGYKYFGASSYKGQAVFTLIVVGDTYRVLVDDKSVGVFTGFAGKLDTGTLGYTIVSGTNTDYGTKCDITNADLWQITP